MSAMAARWRAPSVILVDFGGIQKQRRMTVLFRFILAIPLGFVLFGVGIGAFFVTIYAWFAALFTGRIPDNSARFLVGFLRRVARIYSYFYLLTDNYPPFDGDPNDFYPVDLAASPGALNRWAVLFRFPIALPAWVLSSFLVSGMGVFSVLTWLITLVRGSVPVPIFQANSAVIRYFIRSTGYGSLVSSEWAWGSFGDREVYGFGALSEPPLPALDDLPPPPPSAYPPPPPPSAYPPPAPEAVSAPLPEGPDEAASGPPAGPWFSRPPVGPTPPSSVAAEGAASASIGGLGGTERYSAFPDPSTRRESPPLPVRLNRSWTVATSSGAKILLVVFLVLGIAYQAVLRSHEHFRFSLNSTVSALNSTTAAISALNATLTETNPIVATCTLEKNRLACLTQVLGRQSAAYGTLASSLSSISYPASLEADAVAMEQDAIKDEAVYHDLATQKSLTTLQHLADANQAEIGQLQTDFNDHYQAMRQIVVG